MKESFFKSPTPVDPINGFTKHEMDTINKYCSHFGYHPNFKQGLIYDADNCNSVQLIKEFDGIYIVNNGVKDMLSETIVVHDILLNSIKSLKHNKSFSKLISDAFGILSLEHSNISESA